MAYPAPLKLTCVAALVLVLAACSPSTGSLVENAKGLLDKGDPKAALIELKTALDAEPDRADIRFLLGTAMLRSGDTAGALVVLKKAQELGHPADEVQPAVARTLIVQGAYKAVVDQFADTRLSSPEANADLKVSLATAHANLGQGDKVAPLVDEAYALAPTLPVAMLAKARLLAGSNDLEGALKLADAVLAQGQLVAEVQVFRGDVFMRTRAGVDKALVAYQAALQADPSQVNAHVAVIGIEISRGNREAAQRALQAFRKAMPKNLQVPYVEAQLAYIQKDYVRTREILELLLRAYPDIAALRMFAGATHLQLGSLLSAESNLAKAIQLEPRMGMARHFLARTYLRMGQPDRALTALAPLLGGPAPAADTLAIAGEAYLQAGDFARAEAVFGQSLKLKPNDPAVQTAAALALLARGQADAAFKGLQAVAETDPGATANLAIISARMRRGEYKLALEAIDELARKQPKEPQAASLRGAVLLAQRDVPGARTAFEAALALQPAYFPASRQLAALDLADKQPDRARQRMEDALKANPQNADARLILVDLRSRAGADKAEIGELLKAAAAASPTHAPTQLAWIRHLAGTSDRKQQLEAAQSASQAQPDNMMLLAALGDAQMAGNDLQQAIRTYSRIVTEAPQVELGYLKLAEANLAAGQKTAASTALRRGMEAVPESRQLRQRLIALSRKTPGAAQGGDEALGIARTMQRGRPTEPGGFMAEGDIQFDRKQWAAAAAAYRQAAEKSPREPMAAPKAHAAMQAGGDQAGAAAFAAAWLKSHPQDADFRAHLGARALAGGDLALAERHLKDAVALDPRNVRALNNLAWVMAERGAKGGMVYAKQAVALRPSNAIFLDTLAKTQVIDDTLDAAIASQQAAVKASPQVVSFRFNLARLYARAGRKAEALTELDLVEKDTNFKALGEVQQLRKSLGG